MIHVQQNYLRVLKQYASDKKSNHVLDKLDDLLNHRYIREETLKILHKKSRDRMNEPVTITMTMTAGIP